MKRMWKLMCITKNIRIRADTVTYTEKNYLENENEIQANQEPGGEGLLR